jgi:hypothetical protein
MLPAFPELSRGLDDERLPASLLPEGIQTFNFGRIPALFGSAIEFDLDGGGGEVDIGIGGSGAEADFSSFIVCGGEAGLGRGRSVVPPKPKCAASIDSEGPIGVNMLRDFAGARLGSRPATGGDVRGGETGAGAAGSA